MRERGKFTRKIKPRHKTVGIRSVGTRDLNRRQGKRNLIFGSTHILVKAARRQTNKNEKKQKKTQKNGKKNNGKLLPPASKR